jgi:HEAT repeat protein
MWQRMGELCRELATADDTRAKEVWRELTEGGVLEQGCRAAVAAGQAAQETLEECHRWLDRSPRKKVATALVGVLARRCAAGEDQRRALQDWTCRATGCALVPNVFAEQPSHPGRPLSWVHTVFTAVQRQSSWDRSTQQRVADLLREQEIDQIVQGVADPDEGARLRELLQRHPLVFGLDLDAFQRWPAGGSELAFPEVTLEQSVNPRSATGHKSLDALCRLLGSADPRIRLASAVLLDLLADDHGQGQGPALSVEERRRLARACQDEHPVVRGHVLRAASRLTQAKPSARLLSQLGRLLRDPCPAVRIEAAQAATRWQRVTRPVVEGLVALLGDAATSARRAAACAVADLGPRMARRAVLAGLVPLLAEEDASVVQAAARAAGALARRMNRAILQGLLGQLDSVDAGVRREAVKAIGAAGGRLMQPRVTEAVCACLWDADPSVRQQAVVAYGQVRQHDHPPPTERLAHLLLDLDDEVRLVTAQLVAQLGRQVLCGSIIDGLAHNLQANQQASCLAALTAVEQLRLPAATTIVVAALTAVEQLGPPAATTIVVDRVVECLFAPSRELTEGAYRALDRLGPLAEERLVATLTAMLCGTQRYRCVQTLIRVGRQLCRPSLVEQLLELLDDPEPAPRAAAASALEWLGPQAGIPAVLARLEELQDDPDSDVRYHVGNALRVLQAS